MSREGKQKANQNTAVNVQKYNECRNMQCVVIPVITGATGIATKFKEKFGIHTRKTLNRSTTTDSCTGNITHNTESTAG